MTWGTDLAAWRDHMKAAGAPDTTIKLRIYHLGRVAVGLGGTPASTTYEQLATWLADQPWSPNTRRSYRASLRAFYGWAVAVGRVPGRVGESPAHQLPAVRVPRAQPRPTPEEVYRAALDRADDRVRMALLLGGTCGLRRGEIARARREDLERDLEGWSLRVIGKGGHERLVPLTDELARLIRRAPAGWLFPSPHRSSHLTPAHLGKLVRLALDSPGLTTHTLRHRCGTVSYAATKDIRAVQELLGHAKTDTTALYTQVPSSAIRAAMEGAA